MNRALASIGIAATLVCGSAAPALAADNPINAKITYISSGSSQVSSPVTVKGAWSTEKLERTIEVEVRGGTSTPSTRPTVKAETPKTSETKLAKTGTYAGVLAVLVPLIAAIGTIAYIASRKEDN